MTTVDLTRASIVFPILTVLEGMGVRVERHLEKADLPPWIRADPEVLIPTIGTVRLLAQARRAEGIENIGVRSGEATVLDALGVFGHLICSAPTLRGAFEAVLAHHRAFTSNGRMWLVEHADRIEFCQAISAAFDDGWQQANHYALMLMLGIVRLGAGPAWCPAEVKVQTGESKVLRDVAAFGRTRLEFDQPATAIVVPRALLDAPLPSFGLPIGDRVDAWREAAPAGDFAGGVGQVIEMLSWESYPNVRTTAATLGTSVRTLQRHLATAGCSHEELVGRARCATAAGLLKDTDSKILDIALDLGYSDHAHFTRAFRRWTGSSPQQYRRTSRQMGDERPRSS
jgi:AraC-like DNA-binding protein